MVSRKDLSQPSGGRGGPGAVPSSCPSISLAACTSWIMPRVGPISQAQTLRQYFVCGGDGGLEAFSSHTRTEKPEALPTWWSKAEPLPTPAHPGARAGRRSGELVQLQGY